MATLNGKTLNGNSGKQTYKYDGVINSTINAGAGNDVFRLNFARNSTLNGDAGNDNIKIEWQKSTNKVRVNGGAGNDTIDVDGSVSTVDGGAGNDSISVKGSNWSVNGGAGNDTIQLWGWDTNLTVSGGADKDTFLLMGPRYNDAGKPITATWATITDLSAEDTLRFAINPEVARSPYYAKGKKNPFHGKDGKISSLTATRSGSTVTLKDAEYRVNLVLKNINDLSRLGNVKVFNGSKAKKATTLRNLVTLPKLPKGIATKGSQLVIGNTFKGTFDFGKYFSWAKNINASSSKQKLTIKGDVQNNTITVGSAASVLYGLGGNDKLTGGKANDKLYGGAGNDNLNGGGGNDSLCGEAGNDVLTGGAGNDTFVYAQSTGKDVISDYNKSGADTLYISSGSVSKVALSGSNMVFTVGSGTVTLTGAGAKTISMKDSRGAYTLSKTALTLTNTSKGTFNAANYLTSTLKTIDGRKATQAVNLYGNAMNNVIYAGKAGGTLRGYAGNDTLYGGAGKDIFYYDSGNDTIYNYTVGDTIDLGSLTISSFKIVGNDNVLTLSNGKTITVKNGSDIKLTVKTKNETQKVGANVYNGTSGADTYTGTANVDLIRGLAGNDKLQGGDGNDSLYGGDGDDDLQGDLWVAGDPVGHFEGTGDDYLEGGAGNDWLYGGKGNDTLIGGKGIDQLYGGAGDDYLDDSLDDDGMVNTFNSYLEGGSGNDTLIGGRGANKMVGEWGNDYFCCGSKDGASEDYIQDYNANETGEDDVIVFMDDLTMTSAAKTSDSEYDHNVLITLSNGSTILVYGAEKKTITYKQQGQLYTLAKNGDGEFVSTPKAAGGMIANSAPIVGTSSAQLSSLVSTTQTGNLGALPGTGLASPEASGSSLIAANGTAASNPLTNKKTA